LTKGLYSILYSCYLLKRINL